MDESYINQRGKSRKDFMQKEVKTNWPGERVSYEELRLRLQKMSSAFRRGALHYALTLPDHPRQAGHSFAMRICHYDHLPEKLVMKAAFDGIVSNRDFYENDIFVGGYNSGSWVVDMDRSTYGGFSVIFHLQHIRLHYILCSHGKVRQNIYYHSRHPAGGALRMMLNALDGVIHDNRERDGRCRPLLEAIIGQLRFDLDEEFFNTEVQFDPLALRIKDYLDSNFQYDINCSSVCDALRINRTWGSQIFHKNFGVVMSDYLQNLRLNAARHLLAGENGLTIREISDLCAFSDAGYFARVFRSDTGMTPGEFRKQNKK